MSIGRLKVLFATICLLVYITGFSLQNATGLFKSSETHIIIKKECPIQANRSLLSYDHSHSNDIITKQHNNQINLKYLNIFCISGSTILKATQEVSVSLNREKSLSSRKTIIYKSPSLLRDPFPPKQQVG